MFRIGVSANGRRPFDASLGSEYRLLCVELAVELYGGHVGRGLFGAQIRHGIAGKRAGHGPRGQTGNCESHLDLFAETFDTPCALVVTTKPVIRRGRSCPAWHGSEG